MNLSHMLTEKIIFWNDGSFTAFLLAIFISEILSYGMFWEVFHLPWHNYSHEPFPTPFISHISYSTLVAFAVILLINRTIYDNENNINKITRKER